MMVYCSKRGVGACRGLRSLGGISISCHIKSLFFQLAFLWVPQLLNSSDVCSQ